MCLINGPFCQGEYNDLDIFCASLESHLKAFEQVEADDGYLGGAPLKVKCPNCLTIPEGRNAMMQKVQA